MNINLSKKVIFISISCLVIIMYLSDVNAAGNNRDVFIAKFDSMDNSINKGDGYSTYTNEMGTLAWAESYLLEAYLDMYEATGNSKYLASFVKHADRIVRNTDQKRGLVDYKERSAVGWSSTKYSANGERIVWLVHSGMITYPLARFAWLVKKNRLDVYSSQAKLYTDTTKAAMAFFDQTWVYDAASGKGYYQFFPDEPISANYPPPMPLPFNQQLAAGRTFLMLYEGIGSVQYHQKAEALARHFLGYLTKGSDGAYTWFYWYGKGYDRNKTVEDISHGAIDIDFAVLACRAGTVFTQSDMNSFLQTYTKKIRKNGKFADFVNGKGEDKFKDSVGRWLELADFSCVPWNDFSNLLSSGTLSGHPQVMLGVAKLVKFYGKCK